MGTKKLTLANTLGFGVGSVGENIGYTVFYNFFLFYLTDVVGLPATMAGVISLVAVLWDAVTDPAIGYLSDTSRNPKGRRRPIILKGCFGLGVAIFLMFTDLQFLPTAAKGFYFLIANMLFWLFLTMSDIPHLALAAELEDTPEGRTKLRSVAAAFLQGGMLIASVAMLPLVNYFGAGNVTRGWSIAGAIMGICATSAYLITVVATKGLEPENPNLKEEQNRDVYGFIKSTLQMLTFKPYLILLVITFFVWGAANIQNSSVMYFCTYNAGMTDGQIAIQFLVVGVACAILPILAGPVTNKFGKKATAGWAYSVLGVLMIVVSFIKPWDVTYVYLFRVLSIFHLTFFYVTIYSMVFDVSDLDELVNDNRRDGGMQAMFQFSIKLSTALSMFFLGILLDVYGYKADAAVQTMRALNGIKDLTILMIYPISNKRMLEITSELKQKQANDNKGAGLAQ